MKHKEQNIREISKIKGIVKYYDFPNKEYLPRFLDIDCSKICLFEKLRPVEVYSEEYENRKEFQDKIDEIINGKEEKVKGIKFTEGYSFNFNYSSNIERIYFEDYQAICDLDLRNITCKNISILFRNTTYFKKIIKKIKFGDKK